MALASTSATASAAVLKNPFLGARRALANAASLGAAKPVTRRVVVVAAAVGKKSWIPAVKSDAEFINPSWLDGSLPGDFGFDPLGLGKDPAFLKWYREAELIHGRWAMAAVLGIFIGQAYSGVPWFEAGAQPGAVAPFSFGSLLGTQLLLMGWVESKRWVDFFNPDSQSVEWATPWSRTAENFANFTGEQGYPSGSRWPRSSTRASPCSPCSSSTSRPDRARRRSARSAYKTIFGLRAWWERGCCIASGRMDCMGSAGGRRSSSNVCVSVTSLG
ncbi:unnamed protein product [Triticum turgidum subsp. durum]|uniref:Chlorophyll a-b binding protein, chloroplastic n=1 Tax=Triticum turgidum subsp. durum TaxID=4567 RepID=A0A9R1R9B0_TRITD|nr:unnamed protein product [Triticum turgidum subsp. durum]